MRLSIKPFAFRSKFDEKDNVIYLPPSETILEHIFSGFFILDNHWHVVYINKVIEKLLDMERKDLIGRNIWEVLPDAVNTPFCTYYHRAMEEGVSFTFEEYYEPLKKWFEVKVVPTLDGLMGYVNDITERKEYEQKIEYMAYHDQTTGLPNRYYLIRELNERISRDPIFALGYLDIDRFKNINDGLGYNVGERLLGLVANRLTEVMGEEGFVARLSGDQFAIILKITKDQTDKIEKIFEGIIADFTRDPFVVDDYKLYITVSLGVCLYPLHGQDSITLMKYSNLALNHAKVMGKNRVEAFKEIMDIYTYKRLSLESDLRKALEENELELFFQPRVDAKSGAIVGAEALIRWNHSVWGMLTPPDIIPIAEEIGLMHSLSLWVLNRVCQLLHDWWAEGLNLTTLSINVPAQLFISSDFVPLVRNKLEELKVEGKWLEIEVTETSILDNEGLVERTIRELKKIQVKVSIDDFGKGYSSLEYLTKYQIDGIKIDNSFIQNLRTREANVVVKTIIHLAHGLGMKVVAEGVETFEQLKFLSQQQCDEVQGFLFSEPISAQKLADVMKASKLLPKSQKQNRYINQRKYFRVELFYPWSSQMTIVKFKDVSVKLGRTEVLIENIGLGGLCFLSHLILSVYPEIIYEFEVAVLGHILYLQGRVVWKDEVEEGINRYGVEFIIPEVDRDFLAKLLNRLMLLVKKSPIVPNCKLVQHNKFTYIKSLNKRGNLS